MDSAGRCYRPSVTEHLRPGCDLEAGDAARAENGAQSRRPGGALRGVSKVRRAGREGEPPKEGRGLVRALHDRARARRGRWRRRRRASSGTLDRHRAPAARHCSTRARARRPGAEGGRRRPGGSAGQVVESSAGARPRPTATSRSRRGQAALEQIPRRGRGRWGTSSIGTEHLLLALVSDGGGVAAQVLGRRLRCGPGPRAGAGDDPAGVSDARVAPCWSDPRGVRRVWRCPDTTRSPWITRGGATPRDRASGQAHAVEGEGQRNASSRQAS